LGKFRDFLERTLFKSARDKAPGMEKYFQRSVLRKIELKADGDRLKMDLGDDRLYRLCLFGTLLSSVAHVDDHFDDREEEILREILARQFSFSADELEILFQVVKEQSRQGFDFYEVVTEFNRLVPYADRVKLMDCFFAVAVADGELSHEEGEEVRRITKAMLIPHNLFIESKKKALSRIR